jgi:hypothetical protein
MRKKITLLVSTGVLFLFPGCKSQTQQVSADGKPAVIQAAPVSAESAAPTKVVESQTAPSQQEDPIFHGLKLGVALDSQLSKCATQTEGGDEVALGSGLCYLADTFEADKHGWGTMVIMRGGQSVAAKTKSPELTVVLLPTKMKERGSIEMITSIYPPERLGEIRRELTEECGTPIDENGWIRWPMPWGRIELEDWSAMDFVVFKAETTRFHTLLERAVNKALRR